MKKIVLMLFTVFMCSMLSAKIMIQMEGTGVGGQFTLERNTIPQKDFNGKIDFAPNYSFVPSVAWEFNSKNQDIPYHFFAGAFLGVGDAGLPYGVEGGFEWKITELGFVNLGFMTTLQCGVFSEIYGGANLWTSLSGDIVFELNKRFAPYIGVGAAVESYKRMVILKEYGTNWFSAGFAGGHIVAGIKF